VGFVVWIQASESETTRLPSPSAVQAAFIGATFSRQPLGGLHLELDGEWFEFGYDEDVEYVGFISVDRPSNSMALWEGMFRLLSEYDMFMYWPDGDRLIAAMARSEVRIPEDMPAEPVLVGSAMELMSLVEAS
jgi:hypothetical protein